MYTRLIAFGIRTEPLGHDVCLEEARRNAFPEEPSAVTENMGRESPNAKGSGFPLPAPHELPDKRRSAISPQRCVSFVCGGRVCPRTGRRRHVSLIPRLIHLA